MWKKIFAGLCLALVVLVASIWLLRNSLLNAGLLRVQERVKQKYGVVLSVDSLKFAGFDKIEATNITLTPENTDTLIQLHKLIIDVSLSDLASFRFGLDHILISHSTLRILNTDSNSNISFLNRQKENTNTAHHKTQINYKDIAIRFEEIFHRALKTQFDIYDLKINYTDSLNHKEYLLPATNFDGKNIYGLIVDLKSEDTISFKANVDASKKLYRIEAEYPDGTVEEITEPDSKNFKCRFNLVTATLQTEITDDTFNIESSFSVEKLKLHYWRLSKNDVIFNHVKFTGNFRIGDNNIAMDSSSYLKLNSATIHPFIAYSTLPQKVFTLQLKMPETVADTFFNSLPQGMFSTLEGISCTGTLAYNLQFVLPIENPDSLLFNSELRRKNLSIIHFGNENFSRINYSFDYDAYDRDNFVRQIHMGTENPKFTTLHQISPTLINSVLQSEDPSFMRHRGFLLESFRESIIQNVKEKRFARGGSTISMQLVKNVFLNRNKTISRKVEEALIAYLIENLNLVSKERMLEIYMNAIEWGPNIYGIGEASQFYFNKRPSEINLQESIFLAGIIPNPKFFRYQFDKEGRLRSYMHSYFRILSGRMASRGLIPPIDTAGFVPNVQLKGRALRMILPSDSVSNFEY
jgi:hypothetical protein